MSIITLETDLTQHTRGDGNACKRLRFASAVVIDFLPIISEAERRASWYSEEEMECMISKASYSADESRRNKVLLDALDQALRDARRLALAQNANQDDAVPSVSGDRDFLYLWCQYGHSRRGLERLVSRNHQITRTNIIKKVRSIVLTLSRSGAEADQIRTTSGKASRSSLVFAQMIATADAQAALHPIAERRRSVVLQDSKLPQTHPPKSPMVGRSSNRMRLKKVASNSMLRIV